MIEEIRAINEGASRGRVQITKIRYSHDAMIDILIANPWVSQGDLGKHFGYSDAWVSVVMATDMFKARLAARRAELVDPTLEASLAERMEAIIGRSMAVLAEKLANPIVSQIPDNLVLRSIELGAKALGMGGNAPPPAAPINPHHLEGLASRLLALQSNVQKGLSYATIEDVTEKPQPLGRPGSEGGNLPLGQAAV